MEPDIIDLPPGHTAEEVIALRRAFTRALRRQVHGLVAGLRKAYQGQRCARRPRRRRARRQGARVRRTESLARAEDDPPDHRSSQVRLLVGDKNSGGSFAPPHEWGRS